MAAARFFSRATQSALAVLQGFEPSTLLRHLESQHVAVVFDRSVVESPEACVTLELAVNLLARLYPRLRIAGDPSVQFVTSKLETIARSINPVIELIDTPGQVSVTLAVGRTPVASSGPVIYLGSAGWTATYSSVRPGSSGQSDNPIGAAAAACVGAALVFREIFKNALPYQSYPAELKLSLLRFAVVDNLLDEEARGIGEVDLGEIHLVGAGAVGNALVWALTKIRFSGGSVSVVDQTLSMLGTFRGTCSRTTPVSAPGRSIWVVPPWCLEG